MLPDDEIDKLLDFLLNTSEPGAEVHHMVVAFEAKGKVTTSLYAILYEPDPTITSPEELIAKTILVTGLEAIREEKGVVFAGLSMEGHAVVMDGGIGDDLAGMLRTERRLEEHPNAAEVTRVYAATPDGRRWTGERWLTGPEAGRTHGPTLRTGVLAPQESGLLFRLIRGLVEIKE